MFHNPYVFLSLKIPQSEKLDRKKIYHNLNYGGEEMGDLLLYAFHNLTFLG